jgi:ABC-2 type transport system permease protein
MWLTVNYLGDPDNGAIFTAYLGSLLMAGGFLAIGACISATTATR